MVDEANVRPVAAKENGSAPAWHPAWAKEFDARYRSRTACLFVLHGNVGDRVLLQAGPQPVYGTLQEFLAAQFFGRWDVVIHYDVGRGVRLLAGSDRARLFTMVQALGSWGVAAPFPRDPDAMLQWLDAGLERNLVVGTPSGPLSVAVVLSAAEYLLPDGDPAGLPPALASRLVRLLDWARNPYFKQQNVVFCLLAEKRSELNDRLLHSPYVADLEVPLPDEAERRRFVESIAPGAEIPNLSDFTLDSLTRASNGLSLVNVEQLLAPSLHGGRKLTAERFRALKKELIERQCEGLLEFVEPKRNLEMVVGAAEAVRRLKVDAGIVSAGNLDAAPMGYLVCGPVGTGKTFLAECYSGSIGVPCVTLKNFRSKYVGETEGNLERVLRVLRSLGPVVVIIDEADAALGDRQGEGDGGTSSRVFSMIAAQMGDTKYRGKIIWMLLTSRPDRLPIDLKRQGRAEVHIPLFYPQSDAEFRAMFAVLGKRLGADRTAEEWQKLVEGRRLVERQLSGADVESIILSARREALAAGEPSPGLDRLLAAVDNFIPSSQGLEKEGQEIAAVLECTQLDFLPQAYREKVSASGGRARLQERLQEIRRLLGK